MEMLLLWNCCLKANGRTLLKTFFLTFYSCRKAPSKYLLSEEIVQAVTNAVDNDEEEIDKSDGPVQRTGRVVGIIKKNWKPVCGSFDPNSSPSNTWHLFLPADKRIPRIRVKSRNINQLFGQRIVVVIDSWPISSRRPSGHFVRVIGQKGDKETETEIILMQHDIPFHPFSQEVLKCLPLASWTADLDPDSKNPVLKYTLFKKFLINT